MGKNDLLTFYDGDDLTAKILGQYSGSRPRFKLYTSMADVTIQFQSDPATNIYGYNNGFVVHFFAQRKISPAAPAGAGIWPRKGANNYSACLYSLAAFAGCRALPSSATLRMDISKMPASCLCYPGFEVVGTEMLMCQWDLTWSGDLPSCERGSQDVRRHSSFQVSADRRPADLRVQVLPLSLTKTVAATAGQKQRGPLSGSKLLTRHANIINSLASPVPFSCPLLLRRELGLQLGRLERILSCPDPGTVEHSRRVMSGPRLIVGSTVQYICNKGYSLSGNSLLSCYHRDSTGPKWSEKLPKCIPDSYEPCRNPGTPPYTIQSSEKHVYQAGETVRFSCMSGYELQGEPVLRCVPGHPSKWSHPPPLCKAVTLEYVDERRLDVASADFSMEGASVAVSIFIPVAVIIIIIIGESAFENPIYETAVSKACTHQQATLIRNHHLTYYKNLFPSIASILRPMIQSSHQRYSLGFCCKERACKES
ncbi:hypothetical protein H4Q32_013134 [Labeo rohita]|uniref:Sushi domain-containing protein n=1 Tax=Labeo rohita TaxID=84645 RepID=A0ABQ8M031_LABRO|nr:hypothetical protein H4Q32_013134 [Labeo rohita]